MVRNLYRYMVVSMIVVCCSSGYASQADEDFINRSKDKNARAVQEFNKILDKKTVQNLNKNVCLMLV